MDQHSALLLALLDAMQAADIGKCGPPPVPIRDEMRYKLKEGQGTQCNVLSSVLLHATQALHLSVCWPLLLKGTALHRSHKVNQRAR